MNLRPMLPENVEFVAEMERYSSAHPWSAKSLLQSVEVQDDCKIGSVNDEDIGYFVVRHIAGVSEILNLVIFHPQQGKGLGKKLLQGVLQQADFHQSKQVWLEVRESNLPARKLYIGSGFIEQSIRKNYYPVVTGSNSRGTENAVLMSRVLDT